MIVLVGVIGGLLGLGLGAWLRQRPYRPEAERGPALGWGWVAVAAVGLALALITLAVVAGTSLELFLVGALFAVAGLVGVWTDLDSHRLPDWLTLPLAGGLTLLITVLCVLGSSYRPLVTAALGAVLLGVVFLAGAVFTSLGFGDVKLALSIGLVLGFCGLASVVTGLVFSCLIALGWAVTALMRGRSRTAHMPLGPALIVGTFLAVLVSPTVN